MSHKKVEQCRKMSKNNELKLKGLEKRKKSESNRI